MRRSLCLFALLFAFVSLPHVVRAQEHPVTLEFRMLSYGDNTEFLGDPYADGTTWLGEQVKLSASMPIAEKVRVKLGVQTDIRAGDSKAFHSIWPVATLEVGGSRDAFIMGTLRSAAFGRDPDQGLWPDESGPHGLVPPLQVDTLTFTQSNDAGLQWLHNDDRFTNDLFVAWRQLDTGFQREQFNVGFNSSLMVSHLHKGSIALVAQGHLFHQGGQLTHAGAVGESLAGGPGVQGEYRIGQGVLRAEVFALFSRNDPDRRDHTRPDFLCGRGVFSRVAYELKGWRGAWIMWRGADFIKWEGDPNYGSLLNDDNAIHGVTRATRTYSEFSLSHQFTFGNDAALLANGRLYRVDDRWDYAYRVVASVRVSRVFSGRK